jgi:hypothetical protein
MNTSDARMEWRKFNSLLFEGGFVIPTHERWNHSLGQLSMSQATISPKLTWLQ